MDPALLSTILIFAGTALGIIVKYFYDKANISNNKLKIEGDLTLESKRLEKEFDVKGFELFMAAYKEDMKDVRERLVKTEFSEKQCLDNYTKLKEEYNQLKLSMQILEVSMPSLPTPMWTKSDTGVMLAVNAAYEDLILKPIGKKKEDYVGKTDVEFWGKEIGQTYYKNDLEVMRDKATKVFIEPIYTEEGKITSIVVIKYVRTIENQFVVGIGGIAIDSIIAEEILSKFQTYKEHSINTK